jgi:hypothetical protein
MAAAIAQQEERGAVRTPRRTPLPLPFACAIAFSKPGVSLGKNKVERKNCASAFEATRDNASNADLTGYRCHFYYYRYFMVSDGVSRLWHKPDENSGHSSVNNAF